MDDIQSNSGRRILLGQLGANGDCLLATTLARQIKNDNPGCHLTWAVHESCAAMVEGNPEVDAIWEIPAEWGHHQREAWHRFEAEAKAARDRGEFDEIILSQIYPNNTRNFDGTVRPSILRAYGGPITVPVVPALRTKPSELNRVQDFVMENQILITKNRIIFECSSKSGQSYVTPEYALEAAYKIIERMPSTTVILSSDVPIRSRDVRILDGSVLSIRETALLTHFSTLLIGCASGISCAAISEAAQHLPMVQLLSRDASVFGSFATEFDYWDMPTDDILEMTDVSIDRLVDCVEIIDQHGFDAARDIYNEKIPVHFKKYIEIITDTLIKRGKYLDAAHSATLAIGRFGLTEDFEEFIRSKIAPNLPLPKNEEERRIIERLRELVFPTAISQEVNNDDISPDYIRDLIGKHETAEAARLLDKALTNDPGSAAHLYLSAAVRINLDDINGARKILNSLTGHPEYWQKAWNLLGVAAYKKGDNEAAAEAIKRSMGAGFFPEKKRSANTKSA
ncbi:MAG: hypothetical protein ACLFQX_07960 [Candidatus Kapaibacterium sp.]